VDREGRVAFIDFGICGRLTDDARASLFLALPAIVGRDFPTLTDALFSPLNANKAVDRAAVARDLEASLTPVLDAAIDDVSYAQAFVEVMRVGFRHGVLLPKDLILVFKQFFYVERFTRVLAPGWQPLADEELVADILRATA
jgi:predicted unusual protein kinase regulating ubiquinone biosynthesis (AarF/ABC1/UbiB family)